MAITPSSPTPAGQTVLSQRHHHRQRLLDLHLRASELQLQHAQILQQRMIRNPSMLNTIFANNAMLMMDDEIDDMLMLNLMFEEESEEDSDDYAEQVVAEGNREFDDEDSDSEASAEMDEEDIQPIQTEDEKRLQLFQEHQLRSMEAERQAKARSTPSGSAPPVDPQPSTSKRKAAAKKSGQAKPEDDTAGELCKTTSQNLARSVRHWRRSIG